MYAANATATATKRQQRRSSGTRTSKQSKHFLNLQRFPALEAKKGKMETAEKIVVVMVGLPARGKSYIAKRVRISLFSFAD
jgi:hypothetical protein